MNSFNNSFIYLIIYSFSLLQFGRQTETQTNRKRERERGKERK